MNGLRLKPILMVYPMPVTRTARKVDAGSEIMQRAGQIQNEYNTSNLIALDL